MNKYLVIYEIEGEICEPVIETAKEIFDKMDMADCYDIEIICLTWLKPHKDRRDFCLDLNVFPRCQFLGAWHDGNDPLKMEIRTMFGESKTLDIGYGTDH